MVDWKEARSYQNREDGILKIKEYSPLNGPARNMKLIDIDTGSGLEFTVVCDRGMDIETCKYHGVSVMFLTAAGLRPAVIGGDFRRQFFAGMLTTCGMTNVGPGGTDGSESYPQHGTFNLLPAEEVSVERFETEGTPAIAIRGILRDASLFGYHLECRRSIEVKAGDPTIHISDIITNRGSSPAPLMMLYHVNLGWPLLEPGAIVYRSLSQMTPRDIEAEKGFDAAMTITAPAFPFPEQVFIHHGFVKNREWARAGIFNPNLQFGVEVCHRPSEMPYLTLWKLLSTNGDYVIGIEPGTNPPLGRLAERANDRLAILKPGESVFFSLDIGIKTMPPQINQGGFLYE